MKSKTILIFGISSFLGSSLAQELKKDYRVVGTYYDTPVDIEGILTLKCDVHNKDLVQKVTLLFKPDITIYAVGLTDLNACQEFPKVADALNTAGVFNVSAASERYNSKFIYFSSGYIFSGENTLFRENDTPTPSSIYGNTVASSEFYIQKSCLNYLIFRCSPIYGRSYNSNDLNWMEVLERNSFLNQKIVCDSKVYTGFLDVWTVAEVLKIAIENNSTNRLFQLSSTDVMSRYDFSQLFLKKFGGNTGLLSKGDWKFPRTENTIALQGLGEELFFQMDVFNVEDEFNIRMPSIESSIEKAMKTLSGSVKKSKKQSAKAGGVTFI
jgi:dTDP-4-dehydrorhamnose reductase